MTADRWAEIDRLFQEASSLAEPQRRALLDDRCAGDPELRREVESLLANDNPTDGFLVDLIGEPETAVTGWSAWPAGTRIGDYVIERLIGSGGMGSVYLAQRADGEFDQKVAIKFANSLSSSDWTAERFRMERRILARLEHPNIARLLGGGTAPNGAPYLVMEYVAGEPLTAWCARRTATMSERLHLFLGVCDAVAHAHRNLVVHRDIKPGNILVTDGAVPKLLDFGISKVFEPDNFPGTSATVRIMTVGYASPEQVQGYHVTTATDVYSLGAVLYELLAGLPPFPVEDASPLAVQRAICEKDPIPPSACPGSVSPKGDLDHIVFKAMRKDVQARYSSVEQLASDVRAYLEKRPVTARSSTPWYRVSRFVRRHRAAVMVAVILAIAGTAVAAKWISDARRMTQFYRELRTLSRAYLAEVPDRVAGKSAPAVRREIGKLFDERMQLLLTRYGADTLAVREIALGYEALANQFGIAHERAAGMLEEALFYYGRARSAMQPLYAAGRADKHGTIIFGRSHCGVARIQERMAGASASSVSADYQRCLEILREAIGTADPAPGVQFVREFVFAHLWAGLYQRGNGNPEQARALFETALRIARGQRSRDNRAGVWAADALLRLTDMEPAQNPSLIREAWEQFRTAKPPRRDIDIRLVEMRLAAARARIGDASADTVSTLAAALERDYPSHPLALETAAAARAVIAQ